MFQQHRGHENTRNMAANADWFIWIPQTKLLALLTITQLCNPNERLFGHQDLTFYSMY